VVDPTLVEAIDVTDGLKDGGYIIINSPKKPEEFKFPDKFKVFTIDATDIAVRHQLGTLAAPIVNTAIVGAVAKILTLTKLESLIEAIKEGVPQKPEENVQAAIEAYEKA
jgi:2-oxoacid:acceptor oxidoreductase gamma subunit (pyruvate/2-ketoisovalerate family)